jgi:hypothetical protein
MSSHPDQKHQLTPRPGAVKGMGCALATRPLTALRARGAGLLAGRGEVSSYRPMKGRLF